MLDPVTGGLAYLLHQAVQGSIPILCLLAAIECALAAGWLAAMRYSARVRGTGGLAGGGGAAD
jgi:hypothetical protein